MSRVSPAMRDAAVRAVGARVMLSELPPEVQTAIGDLLHAATIVEREACAKAATNYLNTQRGWGVDGAIAEDCGRVIRERNT